MHLWLEEKISATKVAAELKAGLDEADKEYIVDDIPEISTLGRPSLVSSVLREQIRTKVSFQVMFYVMFSFGFLFVFSLSVCLAVVSKVVILERPELASYEDFVNPSIRLCTIYNFSINLLVNLWLFYTCTNCSVRIRGANILLVTLAHFVNCLRSGLMRACPHTQTRGRLGALLQTRP